jgi:hypothetical protein
VEAFFLPKIKSIKMKKITFTYILLFTFGFLFSQNKIQNIKKVVAGPMLGYTEQTECLIWIQTVCAKTITIKYAEINVCRWRSDLRVPAPYSPEGFGRRTGVGRSPETP